MIKLCFRHSFFKNEIRKFPVDMVFNLGLPIVNQPSGVREYERITAVRCAVRPEFMKDIFVTNDVPYSLRNGNGLLQPSARTTNFGIETTPFIGHKLWQTLPNEIKTASSLAVFKNRIKSWKGERCNCRLCRIFIPNLGFLI